MKKRKSEKVDHEQNALSLLCSPYFEAHPSHLPAYNFSYKASIRSSEDISLFSKFAFFCQVFYFCHFWVFLRLPPAVVHPTQPQWVSIIGSLFFFSFLTTFFFFLLLVGFFFFQFEVYFLVFYSFIKFIFVHACIRFKSNIINFKRWKLFRKTILLFFFFSGMNFNAKNLFIYFFSNQEK